MNKPTNISHKHKFSILFSFVISFLLLAFFAISINTVTMPSANESITGIYTFNCTIDELSNVTNTTFILTNSSTSTILGIDYNTSHPEIEQSFFNITYNTSLLGEGHYTLLCNATNSTDGNTSVYQELYIDHSGPILTLYSPSASQQFTVSTLLNWSVSDIYSNISSVGYYLDNYAFAFLNSPTSSVNLNGTFYLNTSTGTHTIIFSSNDTLNNWINSSAITFTLAGNENFTSRTSDLNNYYTQINSTYFINSTGGFASEITNTSQILNMVLILNDSSFDTTITVPFMGSNAEWNKTTNFSIDISASSSNADSVNNNSGTSVVKIAFFKDFGNFLSSSNYNNVSIFFNVTPADLDVLYISDDSAAAIYNMSQCTGNTAPSSVTSTSNMCYVNTSTNITAYIPHLSGVALANDTVAPIINITAPSNNSIITDSQFTFMFDTWEINPAASFCTYNLTNGTTVSSSTLSVSNASSSSAAKYSFLTLFSNLYNNNYNLTLNCTDTKGNNNYLFQNLTVLDTSITNMTSISSSSITTTTAIVSWTTGEYANTSLNYGATTSLGSFATGNSNFTTSHSVSITDLSANTTYYYNVTSCDINSNCNITGPSNFTTLVASSSSDNPASSSSSGSGAATSQQTASVSQVWDTLPPGVVVSKSISNDLIAFTEVKFTLLQSASKAELTINSLSDKPSSVSTAPETAYKYLQVATANIPDISISSASISFKVLQSWISSNNLNADSISLYRWYNNQWNKLETRKSGSNSGYVSYTASTPGFSYFAIAGSTIQQTTAASANTQQNQTSSNQTSEDQASLAQSGDQSNSAGNTTQQDTSETSSGGIPSWVWWVTFIIVVLVAAFMYLYSKYKKEIHSFEEEHHIHLGFDEDKTPKNDEHEITHGKSK